MVHDIEDFYGVYMLYNVNNDSKYKGRIYIGYTVNPVRRVRQHNIGKHVGGAWKTDGKGPWDMVVIVHGFPNEISALRFEWAWQNPMKSRRLSKLIPKKTRKETNYQYHVHIMSFMLRTPPWSRLPLTIRWLKQEFSLDFPPDQAPPVHMPIVYGPCRSVKIGHNTKEAAVTTYSLEEISQLQGDIGELKQRHKLCPVCYKRTLPTDTTLTCYRNLCTMTSHIVCLAKHFLSDPDDVIPIDGSCPTCKAPLLWGELIRYKRGCYQGLSQDTEGSPMKSFDSSEDDAQG